MGIGRAGGRSSSSIISPLRASGIAQREILTRSRLDIYQSVVALKERARRHGRSMEAEARDVLAQLAAGRAGSGAEHVLAQRLAATRSTSWPEIASRLHANPPPPIDDAWVDELHAQRDGDPLTDPWDSRAAS